MLHRYDLTGDPHYELVVTERLTLLPRGFQLRLARRTPSAGRSQTS
jgi:unspecific monooxygenase